MLNEYEEIEESKVPTSLADETVYTWGDELYDLWKRYDQARFVLSKEIWPECDKAWHCIRADFIDIIPSMEFIDDGMLGNADIRTALKTRRDQILQELLPADESWLELGSLEDDDDEAQTRKTKEYLIYLHDVAKARDVYTTFIDQAQVRGFSVLGVKWKKVKRVRKLSRAATLGLKQMAEEAGEVGPDGEKLKVPGKIPVLETVRSQPVLYVIDAHRFWIDPKAELGLEDDPDYVYCFFKTKQDLLNAKDEETGEPTYDHEVIEAIPEWTYQAFYHEFPEMCDSTRLMGIDPSQDDKEKFIPVYLFHKLRREFNDGTVFIDKFIYVARSASGGAWRIIKIQDNPSDYGDRPFYPFVHDRWLNVPYGTGLAEKSLSALRAKDLLDALWLNLSALAVSPPYSYFGGVIKDDSRPKWQPGAGQEIINRPQIGLKWIEPFPVNPGNVMIGANEQQYVSAKIVAQTGATTAGITSNATKSTKKNKTAQEVRQETTDNTITQESIVTRMIDDVVEPAAQTILNLAKQHAEDDIRFVRKSSKGQVTSNKISPDELGKDRQVKVVGRLGMANKAHRESNILQALQILANPEAANVIPTLPLMLHDFLLMAITGLGLPMKPEYQSPPEELLQKDPAIKQAVITEMLQDPQQREQLGQFLINSPEGQQFLQQVLQAAHDQGYAKAKNEIKAIGGGAPVEPQGAR